MKPLSQSGFHRIRHNPNQRNFSEGGVKAACGNVLDKYNETLEGRTLHPTKGYRTISPKRMKAATIVAHIRFGGNASLSAIKQMMGE